MGLGPATLGRPSAGLGPLTRPDRQAGVRLPGSLRKQLFLGPFFPARSRAGESLAAPLAAAGAALLPLPHSPLTSLGAPPCSWPGGWPPAGLGSRLPTPHPPPL